MPDVIFRFRPGLYERLEWDMFRKRMTLFFWVVPIVMVLALFASQLLWYRSLAGLQWTRQISGNLVASCSSPDNELVYLLIHDYNSYPRAALYCFRSSGGLYWQHDLDEIEVSYRSMDMQAAADGVVVSNSDQQACKLDLFGNLVWHNMAAASLPDGSMPGGPAQYVLSRGGRLVGYSNDGDALWQSPFEDRHMSSLDISRIAGDGSFIASFVYVRPWQGSVDRNAVPPPAEQYTVLRRYSVQGELLQEVEQEQIDSSDLEMRVFGNGAMVMYWCTEHSDNYSLKGPEHGLLHYLPAGGSEEGLARIRLDGKVINACRALDDGLLLLTEDVWHLDQDGNLQKHAELESMAIMAAAGEMFTALPESDPLSWLKLAQPGGRKALSVRQIPSGLFRTPRWRIAYDFSEKHPPGLLLLGQDLVMIHDRDSMDGNIDISCYR